MAPASETLQPTWSLSYNLTRSQQPPTAERRFSYLLAPYNFTELFKGLESHQDWNVRHTGYLLNCLS